MRKKLVLIWVIFVLVSLSCKALQLGPVRQGPLTQEPSPSEFAGNQPGGVTATQTQPQAADSQPSATVESTTPPRREATKEERQPVAPPDIPAATHTPRATVRPTLASPALEGAVGEISIGDDYSPELGNTGYDVLKYTIVMALDPSEVDIPSARVTIEASTTLDNLAKFSLDFIGYEIDDLTVNQSPAYYERQGAKLVITLDQPLAQGENFTVEVTYHGEPVFEASPYVPFEDHVGMFFRSELNRMYVVSEPDGSRYWFPCNDHPRDKAVFRFDITAPEDLVAVANGNLVDSYTEVPNAFPDGRAGDRYVWEENFPMATYLATVAIGDYVRVAGASPAGVPLRSYVFPNQKDQMEALTPQVGEAVDWMSESSALTRLMSLGMSR